MYRRFTLATILYYLAFMVAGGVCIPIFYDFGLPAMSASVGVVVVGLYGLLSFVSLDLVDEDSGWYIALGIIRRVISIVAVGFALLMYVSLYESLVAKSEGISLVNSLVLGAGIFPVVFILIRSAVYCFDFSREEEVASLVTSVILPIITYVLSVGMIHISPIWSLGGLFVLWLMFQIFVRGELNGFGRFLFNFVFYGAMLGLGVYFAVAGKMIALGSFMAMAMCFFYFLGIDLCRESDFGYWFFNIIGMVSVLVFFIAGMTSAMHSGLQGMEYGMRCSFPYVWENAIYFAPFVYAVLRAPLYKLAAENEWENGLGDVFVTFLLPFVAYLITIPLLLVGFLYVLGGIVAFILVAMLVMYFKDEYLPVGDYVTEARDSASNYISSITIIE